MDASRTSRTPRCLDLPSCTRFVLQSARWNGAGVYNTPWSESLPTSGALVEPQGDSGVKWYWDKTEFPKQFKAEKDWKLTDLSIFDNPCMLWERCFPKPRFKAWICFAALSYLPHFDDATLPSTRWLLGVWRGRQAFATMAASAACGRHVAGAMALRGSSLAWPPHCGVTGLLLVGTKALLTGNNWGQRTWSKNTSSPKHHMLTYCHIFGAYAFWIWFPCTVLSRSQSQFA